MGRTIAGRLLLTALVPCLLSATCNPKRGGREGEGPTTFAAGEPVPPDSVVAAGAVPAADAAGKTAGTGGPASCPAAAGQASPLGPIVGPACDEGRAIAGKDLAAEIADLSATGAAGMVALTPALGAVVGSVPACLGSAVLQGPPHCYTVVAACEGGSAPLVELASAPSASGQPPMVVSGTGPALGVCPDRTAEFTLRISSKNGDHECGLGIYGD